MKSHLKVKVVSLAAEMTYIRKQELKWKKRAKLAREKLKPTEYYELNFWTNREHRESLKWEARHAHLAYGFMKGRTYEDMEKLCYGAIPGMGGYEPNWQKIEDTVTRFSKGEPNSQAYMQKFSEWLSDAKAWYEGNPERIKAWNATRPDRIAGLKAKAKTHIRAQA